MAAIELMADGVRTTTTKIEDKVQPREVDTYGYSDAVDVDATRACSVELVASSADGYQYAILEAAIETSEDGATGWREVARFDRFKAEPGATVRQRVSFVADRYVRAAYRIAKGYSPDAGGVKFSIAGTAV